MTPDRSTGDRPAGTWDTTLITGVALFAAGCIVVMGVLARAVIPPLVILPILFAGALMLRRRRPRVGTVALAVVGVVAILGNLPFLIDDLSHAGDAPLQFAVSLAMLAGVLTVLVGAVASLRGWHPGGQPVALGAAALVVIVGALVAGVVASGTDSDTALPGDVTVEAENIEFVPERVTVGAGGGVLIDNADLVRHTFTVEDEAIDLAIPAGAARRVDVDLPAGTYEFFCDVPGHESMDGTLVVE